MPCASCKDHSERRMNLTVTGVNKYPLSSNDIKVVDGDEVRKFEATDWPDGKHKLLILLPEIFTYTCSDQIKGMKKWYDEFQKLNCELILVMTDSAVGILDWFKAEPMLAERPYKAFSSYLLPNRLGLIDNGRAQRSAVFITADGGELIKQQAFSRVAPSFQELHRILYAFSSQDYCGSEWKDPTDALNKDNDE